MAKAKIRNVIEYEMYGEKWYNTGYESGIVRRSTSQNPDKTVIDFISKATKVTKFHSILFDRDEVKYEA